MTNVELTECCREIIEWRRTGLLNNGTGGALRAFAASLDYVPVCDRLSVAEHLVARSAMLFVVAKGERK